MVETTKNVLRPCQCGCETPIIQESTYIEGQYRIVCPKCKNNEDNYFIDSLEGAILAWNTHKWMWGNA